MAVTGATFNFNKTVTSEERTASAEQPADNNAPSSKIAGQKKDSQSLKNMIGVQQLQQVVKQGINAVLSNVEGSQTQAQISALKQIGGGLVTGVTATLTAAMVNPVLGVVTGATQLASAGISYAEEEVKFQRDKAWTDYGIEEYKRQRGYSAMYSRSRSD